ncbi:hypothetical protein PRIPAC_75978 [Pristionchus pacificus]|uniref:Uncharacterized protein n=1 Tax=Pristionchus pacificus TaxID=54126 RepID=A0A2A6BET0_PRIPA|nr:hypothetical protein PRIPAC_75978 [Pristionchus pacificus]|eukprot:PDM64415.1 hypothetical protein PRIPAC_52671 [Pristionchus pacificus]
MEYGIILAALATTVSGARLPRSTVQSLSDETSNVLQEFISAINPIYIVILGCLIAAGCAFELAYGSRGSSGRTTAHVASRNAPYSVRTVKA